MKILNFGSLNIDYVYTVDHFVRPGETISADKREIFPGGKGLNQSIALARAGADVYHAGGIGKADGGFMKTLMGDSGVHTEYTGEYDISSGHTIIQVDRHGQNCIILFGGANQVQTPENITSVLSHFSAGDYLVVQNEINAVDFIMAEAKKRGMKIFLNPSPFNEKVLKMPLSDVDCFLLNEVEAQDICGVHTDSVDSLLTTLSDRFPHAEIVLTLGKKGVVYKTSSGILRHGIYEVPVVDTTAAGDTFTGYFISCMASGMNGEDSLKYASVASSLAVSEKGAAPSIPCMKDVLAAHLSYIPVV